MGTGDYQKCVRFHMGEQLQTSTQHQYLRGFVVACHLPTPMSFVVVFVVFLLVALPTVILKLIKFKMPTQKQTLDIFTVPIAL